MPPEVAMGDRPGATVDGLTQELSRYLEWGACVRNLSEYTLRNYRTDCSQFVDFLRAKGLASVLDTDRPLIRRWLSEMRGQGVTAASLARKAVEVRSFVRYILRHADIGTDPFQGLRLPTVSPGPRQVLTPGQVQAILSALPDDTLGLRDRAIVAVLYSTGLRAAELVNLDLRQMRLDTGEVLRWDAAGHLRLAFLTDVAIGAIKDYLRDSRPSLAKASGEQALFVSRLGRRLTVRSLEYGLASAGTRVGVRLSPHDIRMACAAHLREGGASARAVRRMLATVPHRTAQ
jgi:site-specific recombinase XerD